MPMYPRAGDRVGRYEIRTELGRGAMGAVYLAHDPKVGREVAVKILLPQYAEDEHFLARFEREAAALAGIRSRHIVPIYDVDTDDRYTFLVTEYFSDGDLRARLAARGPLAPPEAIALMQQVCEAVADAHAAGIVHRDIKASNVLLWEREDGLHAYLSDFGIAGQADSELTLTGHGIGTLATMAPERHLGARGDERGDVYSLGCLLYTVLTGSPPYAGGNYQIVHAHLNDAIPQLARDTPGAEPLNALLIATMAKDPADRPGDAADMGARLGEATVRSMASGQVRDKPPGDNAVIAGAFADDDAAVHHVSVANHAAGPIPSPITAAASAMDLPDDTVGPATERLSAGRTAPDESPSALSATIYIPTTPRGRPDAPPARNAASPRTLSPLSPSPVSQTARLTIRWSALRRMTGLVSRRIVWVPGAVAVITIILVVGIFLSPSGNDTGQAKSAQDGASGVDSPTQREETKDRGPRCWNRKLVSSLGDCSDPRGTRAFLNAFPEFSEVAADTAGDPMTCLQDCQDPDDLGDRDYCTFQPLPPKAASYRLDSGRWLLMSCPYVGDQPVDGGLFWVADGKGDHRQTLGPQTVAATYENVSSGRLVADGETAGTFVVADDDETCAGFVHYVYRGETLAFFNFYVEQASAGVCRGAVNSLRVTPPSELRRWQRR